MLNEQRPTAQNLDAHLGQAHAQAVQAQAVAEALDVMLTGGLATNKATHELSSALLNMIIDLQRSLDIVNRPVGAAA